jgi:excinuclease ABC subunit C
MRDAKGSIIYVGKAKNLKKRVSSYFSGTKDVKTRVLVDRIDRIEYITTGNEYEALLLENNLIKEHTPRYNISLKDGKSYPVIRITAEQFPRIFRTRRIIQDGSEYFGPYTDVTKIDIYLDLIERLFPLRKCRGRLKKRDRPCLYYHIGRCSAPCCGKISREEYMKHVEGARRLLSGETAELLAGLKEEMQAASMGLNFEKAAELRDTIAAVETVGRGQEVVDFAAESRDYVACAMNDTLCSFVVFRMREGKLIGRDLFRGRSFSGPDEAFTQFFLRYYDELKELPETIYTSGGFDISLVETFFLRERGTRVGIIVPEEGRHARILRMVMDNAVHDLEKRLKSEANISGLEELKKALGLKTLPRRIEGFDIAQLSGKHPVASMVSFHNGTPDKSSYRRFHIKTLEGKIDDYEAIREVVARRYSRVVNEQQERPDLIVIDGGKGQVNAARAILNALGLKNIAVIGLAKQFEEIHFPGSSEPVRLPEGNEALRIVQAVRDESHRFATGFNKQLRKKGVGLGLLESIPGIGPKRAALLLTSFGSLENIGAASGEEITALIGGGKDLAEAVRYRVRGDSNKLNE